MQAYSSPSTSPLSSPMAQAMSLVKEDEERRQEAQRLRTNIERFVDGFMDGVYPLSELLNESFTYEMLELLFKRMTAKLRGLLFSKERVLEFISIALDPSERYHTRRLATSFLVIGAPPTETLMECNAPEDKHECDCMWDLIFSALKKEAETKEEQVEVEASLKPKRASHRRASTAEMSQIINQEVTAIANCGAESLERTTKEQMKTAAESSDETDNASDSDDETSPSHDKNTNEMKSELQKEDSDADVSKVVSRTSAMLASQILRYLAVRGYKAVCILRYLSSHENIILLLLANLGHDDIRIFLLHLIYADHSEESLSYMYQTRLIERLIKTVVMAPPPHDAFERDRVENAFLLLREIVHAPYLTPRGVAISAKTIPLDKVTGQPEYVSISGASRETANSSLRKYTSRKVRRLVHLFLADEQSAMTSLFERLIPELTFWSSPLNMGNKAPARPVPKMSTESMALLEQGHPRPTCITMLTHLFELTETVDFSEESVKAQEEDSKRMVESSAILAIDCLNFNCHTHLMKRGGVLHLKKLKNELQQCQLSVNCMMGLRVASNDVPPASSGSLDTRLTPQRGVQMSLTLDEIEKVEESPWHHHGFCVHVKKNAMREGKESVVRSKEYFAVESDEERDAWMQLLQQVVDGDLAELEIFCSDDWRSNVREYRHLRESLITRMQEKGHELMVFLKQVVVLDTRAASGYHLCAVVKCLYAALTNESKRLDAMFANSHLLDILLTCYEKFPRWNLLLGEITKMLVFIFGDFKGKRSRRCPLVRKLLVTEGPDAHLFPLLSEAFEAKQLSSVNSQTMLTSNPFEGTDALANLKLVLQAIRLCHSSPSSPNHQRIQATVEQDHKWKHLLETVDVTFAPPSEDIDMTTVDRIAPSSPTSSNKSSESRSSSSSSTISMPPAPSPPSFQEDIINQISRPSYSSAHGFGSSFLEGDGCAFGYLFKERSLGKDWQKVLVVYEYESHKLWYFYPNEMDETKHIQWKWIVPLGVRSRYTHGQDETHTSVGHHGLFVTAYDHNHGAEDKSTKSTRELHLSATKLEDRDLWKKVLTNAASTIQQLCRDYSSLEQKLQKKPGKKDVTQCQDPTCNLPFNLFRRPHACKRCGKWFCAKSASQRLSIPEVGLIRPVRHCRVCFEAAGGKQANVEPLSLFKFAGDKRAEVKKPIAGQGVDEDLRHSLTNRQLYELAHGIISPTTLTQMNYRMARRQNSTVSPRRSQGAVDEVDSPEGRKRFGSDDEEGLSPYSSPLSQMNMLQMKEDIRG